MNNQYLRLMQEPAMMDALKNSSVSIEDANLRSREYAKMFSRNEELRSMVTTFSRRPSLATLKLPFLATSISMHL